MWRPGTVILGIGSLGQNTLIFLKVGAPEPMLKYEAEANEFRLRLRVSSRMHACKISSS